MNPALPWYVVGPDALTGWIRKNPYVILAFALSLALLIVPGCEGKAPDPLAPSTSLTAPALEARATEALNKAAADKDAIRADADRAAAELAALLKRAEADIASVDRRAFAALESYNAAIEQADAQTAKYRETTEAFANIASVAIPGIPAGVIPGLLGLGVAIDNRRKDRLIRAARDRGFAPTSPTLGQPPGVSTA